MITCVFKITDFGALLWLVLGLVLGCLVSFLCCLAPPLDCIWLSWTSLRPFLVHPQLSWQLLWPKMAPICLSTNPRRPKINQYDTRWSQDGPEMVLDGPLIRALRGLYHANTNPLKQTVSRYRSRVRWRAGAPPPCLSSGGYTGPYLFLWLHVGNLLATCWQPAGSWLVAAAGWLAGWLAGWPTVRLAGWTDWMDALLAGWQAFLIG